MKVRLRRRLRPSPAARAALLVASAALSAAVAALVWSQLPVQLNVRTDIVGYPTAGDFNIERYFWAYGLVAGLFPFLTLALYLIARRAIAPGPAEPLGVIALLDRRAPAASGDRVRLAVSAGSIILVGIALGFEIAIGGGWQDLGGIVLAVTATAYGLAVALIAALAVAGQLRDRELDTVLAGVNAVLATLTVLGLAWVSSGTTVTVSSDGTLHHYPWFPWWLGGLVTAAVLAIVLRALRGSVSAKRVESRLLLLLVAPVLLFLFVAVLPGGADHMDSFHEGEQLGAAHLTAVGRFPWRDLLFIHGPLGDVLQPLLSIHVFGDTRWGNLAGEAVLSKPAAVVALFLLCAYLFRDNWLFLVGTQVAILTGWVFTFQVQSTRLLFVPVVILLLAALLRRPTWPRGIAFTTVLLAQAVLTPEGSYIIPAYLGAVLLYELVHREGFSRTIRCGVTTAALGAGWIVFLTSQHALDDFIFYYRTFAPGHELTGGLTVKLGEGQTPTLFGGHAYYVFAAAAPVVLVLLAIWYFAARAPNARAIPVDDWVIGATAVFAGLYYVKFISRTDHVYQPFEVALPVLFYAIYRVVSATEAWLASRPRSRLPRHTVTLPLLVVLLVGAPTSLLTLTRAVPSHLAAFAPSAPPVARVGYVLNRAPLFSSVFAAPPKSVGPSLVHDLRAIMGVYVLPGERIFDFTNNPGLFWYLLRLDPATRYYHVSMAVRQETQHDLIRELRRERPTIVVFSSAWLGLPFWDGLTNEVRHYDISRYLLDNYRPLLYSHGFLIFARASAHLRPVSDLSGRLVEPAATTNLYFRTFPCDWGYAPDFLSIHPRSESGVTLRPTASRGALAVRVPANAAKSYGWLEIVGRKPFGRTIFELSDVPGGDAQRTIRLRTRGGRDTVRVQVGSCSQWHGYRGGKLYLSADPPQPIRSVRLLR
jgi:hypothetical protein